MASTYNRRIQLYIDIDGKQLDNSVKSIRTELRKITNEQANMTIGSQEYIKDADKMNTLQGIINGHKSNLAEVAAKNKGIVSSLESIPGPAGAAVIGLLGIGKAMWALVANPIGATIAAIVASLMLLYKAFTSTDTGAVAMEGTLKSIGNVMDIVIDRAMSYYKMLWSIVTFDWKGVKENATAAFGGISAAVKDAVNAGFDYAKTMDDIGEREAAAQVRMAKLKVEIETLKNASKNSLKPIKERAELAQQAMDKEIELNGIEKGFMKEKADSETRNLASKIQNNKLTMDQKEAQLNQWLQADDTELASLQKKDKAFAEFYDKNEDEIQALQKIKAEEFDKDAEFQKETRRLQKSLSADQKAMLDEVVKAKEEAQKKSVESLEASNSKEIGIIKKRYLEGRTTEDQYNAELLMQEMKFLFDRTKLYKVGSKEYEIAQTDLLEKQVQAEKKVKELLLQAGNELANAKIANLKDGIDKEKAIEEQRWEEELTALEKKINTAKDLKVNEVAYNEAIYKTIEEKEKAHIKAINDLNNAAALQTQMDAALIAEAKALSDQEKFAAARDLAQANYQRDLTDAKGNSALIAQAERRLSDELIRIKLDEKTKKQQIAADIMVNASQTFGALSELVGKETALGKALFLFQQAMAIGQIIMDTTVANSKVLVEYPEPPGIIFAAINTVAAAIGIASVIAQSVAQFNPPTGYAVGGFTNGDGIYRAGEAGKEWISPNWMVKHTITGPIIAGLEDMRRNPITATQGALQISNSFRETNRSSTDNPSLAAGASTITVQATDDPEMKTVLKENTSAIRDLMNWKPAIAI
jgi:hypothetical protein